MYAYVTINHQRKPKLMCSKCNIGDTLLPNNNCFLCLFVFLLLCMLLCFISFIAGFICLLCCKPIFKLGAVQS